MKRNGNFSIQRESSLPWLHSNSLVSNWRIGNISTVSNVHCTWKRFILVYLHDAHVYACNLYNFLWNFMMAIPNHTFYNETIRYKKKRESVCHYKFVCVHVFTIKQWTYKIRLYFKSRWPLRIYFWMIAKMLPGMSLNTWHSCVKNLKLSWCCKSTPFVFTSLSRYMYTELPLKRKWYWSGIHWEFNTR